MLAEDAEHWSLQSELDRKTFETIESLHNRIESREITRDAAHAAASSLYDAVAGLVDKDLMDMLEQIIVFTKPVDGHQFQAAVHPDRRSLILMERADGALQIQHYKLAKQRRMTESMFDDERKWCRVLEQLKDMGMEIL